MYSSRTQNNHRNSQNIPLQNINSNYSFERKQSKTHLAGSTNFFNTSTSTEKQFMGSSGLRSIQNQNKPYSTHSRTYSDLLNNSRIPDKGRQEGKERSYGKKEVDLNELVRRIQKLEEKEIKNQNSILRLEEKNLIPTQKANQTLDEVKAKIQLLQKQFSNHKRRQSGEEYKQMGKKIKEATKVCNTSGRESELVERAVQQAKRELQMRMEDFKNEIRKCIKAISKRDGQFFKSNRKYNNNPISFIYEEHIRKVNSTETDPPFTLNKVTYYIDKDGYLLDQNNVYIINQENKPIQLLERELRLLRKINILEQ